MSEPEKKYGIHGALPEGDPMRNAHLLGDDWEWYRWYETATERDMAFVDMTRKHPHYRMGDHASQLLTKVDR